MAVEMSKDMFRTKCGELVAKFHLLAAICHRHSNLGVNAWNKPRAEGSVKLLTKR